MKRPSRLRRGIQKNKQYLIISQSGRALAGSAKRARIDTHVIDLFADEDTVKDTCSSNAVSGFSGGNNSDTLIKLVNKYTKNNPKLSVFIGSGFEECPDVLMQLEQRFIVIGNHSSVVRQLRNPNIFFKKLQELALPYPVYFAGTDDVVQNHATKDNFLIKAVGGIGGCHIKPYKNDKLLTPANYLQAWLRGKNCSVTFLADGMSSCVLGFNETWVCKEGSDFRFSGAVSNINLADKLRQNVIDAIQRLVVLFKIKGLCSLDFIVEKSGQYSILEVNPRPTATFELYENENGLFSEHLAAFSGTVTAPVLNQDISRALRVLYAKRSIVIPQLAWPKWVTDRPKQGTRIAQGEPVCTVHAEGIDEKDAKAQLMKRFARQSALLGLSFTAV